MVTILKMSAKMGTADLLKIKLFRKKTMTSYFQSMTSPTKFYHVIQIIMEIWSSDQSLVTLAFL